MVDPIRAIESTEIMMRHTSPDPRRSSGRSDAFGGAEQATRKQEGDVSLPRRTRSPVAGRDAHGPALRQRSGSSKHHQDGRSLATDHFLPSLFPASAPPKRRHSHIAALGGACSETRNGRGEQGGRHQKSRLQSRSATTRVTRRARSRLLGPVGLRDQREHRVRGTFSGQSSWTLTKYGTKGITHGGDHHPRRRGARADDHRIQPGDQVLVRSPADNGYRSCPARASASFGLPAGSRRTPPSKRRVD